MVLFYSEATSRSKKGLQLFFGNVISTFPKEIALEHLSQFFLVFNNLHWDLKG